MKLLLGKDTQSDQPVYLTAEGARAVLICGKRGSGKSYTVGVLVEELLAAGERNIIPIIVDPMGVYHTMVQPNTGQQDELFQWGLSTKSYQVRLLIPGEPHALYDSDVLRILKRTQRRNSPFKIECF
ncbi:MAG: ATP-binding protein [Chloroflexi bacterium]|nr:ATP-binding protein [Chloroflexota bacterium]